MILAALGNICGNAPALDAVLGHIGRLGIHTIVSTGNTVTGYPFPDEVCEMLRRHRVIGVQGDLDRRVVRYRRKQAVMKSRLSPELNDILDWTHRNTSSINLEYIRCLKKQQTLTVDGVSICLCHGSPSGQQDALGPDDPDDRFRRERERANANIVICGHGRAPFHRTVDGTLFVHPGSVGAPVAQYAIVDTENTPWTVTIEDVPYDYQPVADRLAEHNLSGPYLGE